MGQPDTDVAAALAGLGAGATPESLRIAQSLIEVLPILRASDCDEMQGFFFSKAVPPNECEVFLTRNPQS